MAGNRTLKLSILADVDNLKKNLDAGSNEVQGFGGKIEKFGKMAGAAFAAAGVAAAAYAGKLAIDGVKAAIEDEAAQVRLANALKNTVGATKEQIAASEEWILKTSLATGKADDELRPALERLTRSTKDIAEAQKLTNLALDIAADKNISVETAANALAKANDGQVGALKKLGITLGDNASNLVEYNKVQKSLEKAQLEANFALEQYGPKSKEYIKASEKVAEVSGKANDIAMQGIDVFGELSKEFAGASSQAADTFAGKMARLKVAFDEGKETVGGYILTAITPMIETIVNQVIPAISGFADGISTTLGPVFTAFFETVKAIAIPIFEGLKSIFDQVSKALKTNTTDTSGLLTIFTAVFNFTSKYLAPVIGTTLKLALQSIGTVVATLITAFNKFLSVVKAVFDKIMDIVDLIKNNPLIKGIGNLVGSIGGSSVPTPSVAPSRAGSATVNNITVNGAIDSEGTARAIVNALNQSMYRGTGGAGVLVG